jgi:hypothetical protein
MLHEEQHNYTGPLRIQSADTHRAEQQQRRELFKGNGFGKEG